MRARSVFRTASFWIFALFAALVILQQSPMPGVYLMLFGAALLAGRLAHIFLAALFVESLLGRLPRALALAPIAAYGAYYSFYAVEAYQIAAEAAQLRRDNPGLALKFDPTTQALVVKDAQIFVSGHDIPVAYTPNSNIKPDGYLSYRVLPRDQCAQARAAAKSLWTSQDARVAINVWGRNIGRVFDANSCILQLPERPTLSVVSVTGRGDLEIWKHERGISEQALDFALDGKPLATYRVASIWRLPAFPTFYIGCALNDAGPAWQCGADFARIFTPINFSSDSLDEALYDGPVSAVLGIKPLTKIDLSNVAPNPDLDGLLAKAATYAQRDDSYIAARDQDLFGKFADFLKDHSYKTEREGAWTMVVVDGGVRPPENLEKIVDRNLGRLIPLRDLIIAKLIELDRNGISSVSPWVDLVKRSLLDLPKDQFAALSDDSLNALLGYLAKTEAWRYSNLYIRVADAGPRTLEFYERDFKRLAQSAEAENVAMAICRIGDADMETREALKERYLKTRPANPALAIPQIMRVNSAFFVALLGLHEEQFLRDNPIQTTDASVRDWYDMVLNGKGRTSVGPDNCMELTDFWSQGSASLAPGLIWKDRAWVENLTH